MVLTNVATWFLAINLPMVKEEKDDDIVYRVRAEYLQKHNARYKTEKGKKEYSPLQLNSLTWE